jgi:hypothetical protein
MLSATASTRCAPQRDATQLIGGLKQRKRWRAAIAGERADGAASGAPQLAPQLSWSWKLDDLPGTFWNEAPIEDIAIPAIWVALVPDPIAEHPAGHSIGVEVAD